MSAPPLRGSWAERHGTTAALVVVAAAVLASAPSLFNGFTYDDRAIVEFDRRLHAADAWRHVFTQPWWPPPDSGTLYRPLPRFLYALLWRAGGGAPWLFHLANLAALAWLAVGVHRLAVRFLAPAAAFAVALLFAVHPVHVEAVAPVVGLAELLMAAGTVTAISAYLALRERGLSAARCVAVAAGTAVAVFSKEQGALVPLALLAAEVLLVRDASPLRRRVRATGVPLLASIAVVVVYAWLRAGVVETAADEPAVLWQLETAAARRWTMLGVTVEWARLLLWPARLLLEYSPPEVAVHREWSVALLPAAVLLAGVVLLAAMSWRRAPLATFGVVLAGLALAPVSNILVPTGVILAERTLLVPSAGVLLALGAWWSAAAPPPRDAARRWGRLVVAAIGLLAVLGAWRSAGRTLEWRDDQTLLLATVRDAPMSYRGWLLLGKLRLSQGDVATGEAALRQSLVLFPDDYQALLQLGDLWRRRDRCPEARPLLERAVVVLPTGAQARASLLACLLGMGDFSAARRVAADGVALGVQGEAFARFGALTDSLERSAR